MSVAAFVFISGSAGLFVSLKTAQNVNAQAKKIAQQTASATSAVKGVASEDNSPEALAAYKVANDMPRLLIIDKMGVNARISQIDADQKEPFAAPESIFDAGLYNPNVKPGEPGVMVLTGLVYGPAKPGIFNNLGNMQVGDNIKIERGDGKQFTYTVKAVDIYENDKVDKNKVLAPIQLGKPGLNLISTSSRFNVRTNRFEKRVAVFAAQD